MEKITAGDYTLFNYTKLQINKNELQKLEKFRRNLTPELIIRER